MTNQTSRVVLDVASQYLSRDLISNNALARLGNLAEQLPSAPLIIFESHLGKPQKDLDFLLCVDPRWINHPQIQLLTDMYKEWSLIDRFFREWEKSSTEDWLKQGVDSFWLEFDTSQRSSLPIIPGIFFPSLEVSVFNNTYDQHIHAVERSLDQLGTLSHDLHVRKLLRHCFYSMPQSARIYAIGDMSARDSNALRVAIAQVPVTKLGLFLKKINWPGKIENIDKLIEQVNPQVESVSIDLDLGKTIRPKLGLEFTNQKRFDRVWWEKILSRISTMGLCRNEKKEALLSWQGYSNETYNPHFRQNQMDNSQVASNGQHYLVRFINHLKIVYKANHSLEAKAYLAIRHYLPEAAMRTSINLKQ